MPTAPSLVERVAFLAADAMPRLRRTTKASSMSPLASCRALRQSPMGAPDFSRSSLTSLASIFTASVVDIISFFLLGAAHGAHAQFAKMARAWARAMILGLGHYGTENAVARAA